jgi:CubicO group peptidase (beta-lactamase class C family)
MTQPVAATPPAAPIESALDAIFQSVNRGDAPGLVVGVAQHDRVLYRRGFGLASVEHGVALTPRTRMRLASVTKHFTALAALLLAEDGRLQLDAPVTTLLPELSHLTVPPTFRQLMTHTGGLRCAQELLYLSAGLAFQPVGATLALQFAQHGENFAPGERQLYNNGGYTLLSLAIERASGLGFEDLLRTRLFEPLGMSDTLSVPSDLQIVPGIATFHLAQADGSWRRGLTPLIDNKGEGAIVTTVDDMLRWLAHLRSPHKTVGSAASWEQLTTTTTLRDGTATPYALGLNRHAYRGVEVLHHGGSLIGVGSQMVSVPAHGLDIIIMTNGALVNPVQMAWQVVDAVLAGHLNDDTPPPLARSERFAHLFGTRWHAPSGMVHGFGDVGGLLGLSFLESPHAPVLRERGESLGFTMDEVGFGPVSIRIADMAATAGGQPPDQLPISDGARTEHFSRLPQTPPVTAEVGRALLGRYRVDELAAEAEVAFDGDQLMLRIVGARGVRAFEVSALSDTVFSVRATDPGAPAFHVLTVEGRAGRLRGFRLSTMRARGLWFERLTASARKETA